MVCLSWLDMAYPLHDCFDSLTEDASAFRNPCIGRTLPFLRVEILLNPVDEAFDFLVCNSHRHGVAINDKMPFQPEDVLPFIVIKILHIVSLGGSLATIVGSLAPLL